MDQHGLRDGAEGARPPAVERDVPGVLLERRMGQRAEGGLGSRPGFRAQPPEAAVAVAAAVHQLGVRRQRLPLPAERLQVGALQAPGEIVRAQAQVALLAKLASQAIAP